MLHSIQVRNAGGKFRAALWQSATAAGAGPHCFCSAGERWLHQAIVSLCSAGTTQRR
jgi:hypothetical protein